MVAISQSISLPVSFYDLGRVLLGLIRLALRPEGDVLKKAASLRRRIRHTDWSLFYSAAFPSSQLFGGTGAWLIAWNYCMDLLAPWQCCGGARVTNPPLLTLGRRTISKCILIRCCAGSQAPHQKHIAGQHNTKDAVKHKTPKPIGTVTSRQRARLQHIPICFDTIWLRGCAQIIKEASKQ
jgi:hypothetical protein